MPTKHSKKDERAVARGHKDKGSTDPAPRANSTFADQKKDRLKLIPFERVGNSVVFPNRLKRTFVSSGTATLTGDGVGAFLIYHTLSLNSAFDPDYTGAGRSPKWWDTYMGALGSNAPYQKYSVVSARVRATFMASSATSSQLADVGLFVRPATTGSLDSTWELYESPNAVGDTLGNMYSSTGKKTFCIEISESKMAMLLNTGQVLDDGENEASYNADPYSEVFVDLCYQPTIAASTNVCYVRWVLEQDVIMTAINESVDSMEAPIRPKRPRTSQQVARTHVPGCLCNTCVARDALSRAKTLPSRV